MIDFIQFETKRIDGGFNTNGLINKKKFLKDFLII